MGCDFAHSYCLYTMRINVNVYPVNCYLLDCPMQDADPRKNNFCYAEANRGPNDEQTITEETNLNLKNCQIQKHFINEIGD